MQRYVLTERGKLLIAMIIVLFLVLPPLILVIRSSQADKTPDADQPKSTPDLTQYLPTPDINKPVSSDSSSDSLITMDLNEGIMTFLFSPELQNTLDEKTSSAVGRLLTSPKNTNEAKLAVEIPQLPDEETAILTSAIINTFNTFNIPLGDIIISSESVRRQAAEYGNTVDYETAYLVIHSVLHLLGYDHDNEVNEKIMHEKNKQIIQKMGIDTYDN